jgi:UDP-N-acetylmuramoyl-tripeptide--D-alanyl-D-alanine ligase
MAILGLRDDTQVAVLEMGMNHFREMAYLSSVAQPDVAVIINIGTMHIEHLGSQEGILKAKLEILEGLKPEGTVYLNGDDPLLWGVRDGLSRCGYFGVSNQSTMVRGSKIRVERGMVGFHVEYRDLQFPIELPVEGEHYVDDALAAICVGIALGVHPEDIQQSLSQFQNMAGRQEILHEQGYTIIKDCYNAGPESMAAALNVLSNQPGRKIAVLGDMLELGVCTHAEHYRVGRIAAEKADLLLAYGPSSSRVIDGAITGGMTGSKARSFDVRDELVQALKRLAKPGDVILFKGSRGMHMELALEQFLAKEK